jgi:uroporphyrin-III C-methyltransferase/precorrin-2 dehydrogenase/sirohydrochlorin ferrochelatase
MSYHPVFLDLRGRRVMVIGGGRIATAKVRELVAAGAAVSVVTPSATADLEELAARGAVTITRRAYQRGDLAGAWLAIAATGDPTVHRAVRDEALLDRIWLNSVDDVDHCSYIAGSVHRQGDIVVAISTGGACPALAVRLRQLVARLVGPEFARFARMARRLRPVATAAIPDPGPRTRFWYRLVDSAAVRLIRRGKDRAALRLARQLLDRTPAGPPNDGIGRVVLVGAGPGDPGLITARGLTWLRAADVVVHDRLVAPALLAEKRADARLVDVGKRPGRASPDQDFINQVLVAEARAGRLVVRLKGGDPFVFGRGGEECQALAEAGIPHEVVPGISAAIAAPAAVGIPVTERGVAAGFAVVTGHEIGADTLDWEALARVPTLVVLMARERLAEIARRLIDTGRSPETAAALIANATLPTQRSVVANLESIAAAADRLGLTPPATLVVGAVADRRPRRSALARSSLPL